MTLEDQQRTGDGVPHSTDPQQQQQQQRTTAAQYQPPQPLEQHELFRQQQTPPHFEQTDALDLQQQQQQLLIQQQQHQPHGLPQSFHQFQQHFQNLHQQPQQQQQQHDFQQRQNLLLQQEQQLPPQEIHEEHSRLQQRQHQEQQQHQHPRQQQHHHQPRQQQEQRQPHQHIAHHHHHHHPHRQIPQHHHQQQQQQQQVQPEQQYRQQQQHHQHQQLIEESQGNRQPSTMDISTASAARVTSASPPQHETQPPGDVKPDFQSPSSLFVWHDPAKLPRTAEPYGEIPPRGLASGGTPQPAGDARILSVQHTFQARGEHLEALQPSGADFDPEPSQIAMANCGAADPMRTNIAVSPDSCPAPSSLPSEQAAVAVHGAPLDQTNTLSPASDRNCRNQEKCGVRQLKSEPRGGMTQPGDPIASRGGTPKAPNELLAAVTTAVRQVVKAESDILRTLVDESPSPTRKFGGAVAGTSSTTAATGGGAFTGLGPGGSTASPSVEELIESCGGAAAVAVSALQKKINGLPQYRPFAANCFIERMTLENLRLMDEVLLTPY